MRSRKGFRIWSTIFGFPILYLFDLWIEDSKPCEINNIFSIPWNEGEKSCVYERLNNSVKDTQ